MTTNEEYIPTTYDLDEDSAKYKDSTYDIVSKAAFLMGVPKRIFKNEHEPPKMEIYDILNQNKNARIIRNLCIIRTEIERGFKHINEKMKYDFRGITSMPEHISQDAIQQLTMDGVDFVKKSSKKLNHHIIEINRILSDRINNCKSIFPTWLNWDYMRGLILMPDGLTEEGTKVAANKYFENRGCYPYQIYINWDPQPRGNILYCDKKFVTILYEQHNDYFTDYSKVSDAGSFVKSSVHEFIEEATRVVMAVDCENSDVYRLCATLKGLDASVLSKITKILLLDDVNTVEAWSILEKHTDIPVEHVMTERVKRTKSLVDIELTARTCMEHYRNLVDSFILVSSDSDYYGLITSLPEARFLVMVEREKCGADMKAALANSGIFYCYIDDFYDGNSEQIKQNALFNEIYRRLDNALHLNVYAMLDSAVTATRIDMTEVEKKRFYDKHIRNMSLVIAENGDVSIELKVK